MLCVFGVASLKLGDTSVRLTRISWVHKIEFDEDEEKRYKQAQIIDVHRRLEDDRQIAEVKGPSGALHLKGPRLRARNSVCGKRFGGDGLSGSMRFDCPLQRWLMRMENKCRNISSLPFQNLTHMVDLGEEIPEGLLTALNDKQVRDLVGYLWTVHPSCLILVLIFSFLDTAL